MIKHNFEKLEIWKRSLTLSIEVIKEIKGLRNFALKDQITRSAISVPSNIAEGSQRNSDKEFIRFLHISKGSVAELYTQIIIAKELGDIEDSKAVDYMKRITDISSMIHSFVSRLDEKRP